MEKLADVERRGDLCQLPILHQMKISNYHEIWNYNDIFQQQIILRFVNEMLFFRLIEAQRLLPRRAALICYHAC